MKVVILIALVGFLVVRRIQRSIGFQPYRESTLTMRIILFGAFAGILLSGTALYPMQLIPDGIGIIAGLVLAYIATNHAQFEKRDNVLYFKTHIWIEVIVVALFIIRFAYRIYIYRDAFEDAQSQQDIQARMQYFRDPFTGFIFLTFCSYYVGYYAFILKEGRKKTKE